jgi:hypothetical protein
LADDFACPDQDGSHRGFAGGLRFARQLQRAPHEKFVGIH